MTPSGLERGYQRYAEEWSTLQAQKIKNLKEISGHLDNYERLKAPWIN